jgi:sugar fermentation stimulation protein A
MLKWDSPLISATLLKRYKRFLADVSLNGSTILAHVPNTGAMTSCWEPDWACALTLSKNPGRKIPYTLELTWNGETWIGVNTGNANKLVKGWLNLGLIPELYGYKTIVPEKKIGESRVDFFLENHPFLPSAYVEVKNVTLKLEGVAQFPDAKTERGQKHLRELMALKKAGHRAIMLFVVQREDVEIMKAAEKIDPVYARLLIEAVAVGVEILVYQCRMSLEGLTLKRPLPFQV